MFKVGNKVRVKANLKEIIQKRKQNGQFYIETPTMIDTFSGQESTIVAVCGQAYSLKLGFVWASYALEPVELDSIRYPMIL